MCVPLGRPAQQMAGVPRYTVLVGNYYIAFSIHYGGKWGPLSRCCFNGPTSCNVAGIYWLSDVNCNLLLWDCCRLSSLDPGRAAPSGGGTTDRLSTLNSQMIANARFQM